MKTSYGIWALSATMSEFLIIESLITDRIDYSVDDNASELFVFVFSALR